ncbi:MAG TPA: hypothetical protein VGE40_08630, partial [Bacilli bacterium]
MSNPRRKFKRYLTLCFSCMLIFSILAGQAYAIVPAQSTFFATSFVEEGDGYNTNSDGDLWPSAWSNDDYLYLANGDGKGWDLNAAWNDIVFNRITS